MDTGAEVNKFLEELNLKAMESVYNLVQDQNRGLISRGAVKQGVRAVFESLSGYLSPKTYEAISIVSEEYKSAETYEIREVKSSGKVTIHVCGTGKLWQLAGPKLPVSIPVYNDLALEPDEAIRRRLFEDKKGTK